MFEIIMLSPIFLELFLPNKAYRMFKVYQCPPHIHNFCKVDRQHRFFIIIIIFTMTNLYLKKETHTVNSAQYNSILKLQKSFCCGTISVATHVYMQNRCPLVPRNRVRKTITKGADKIISPKSFSFLIYVVDMC